MESYYQRNREKRLEYQKNYNATQPVDKKRLSQLYQQEYYQRRRAAGWKPKYTPRQKITILPKTVIQLPSLPEPSEPEVDQRKLPKPYIAEEQDFGLQYARHDQKQRLLENAPKGFYTRPPDANPFLMKWD